MGCIFDGPFSESSAQKRWYAPLFRLIVVRYLMVTAMMKKPRPQDSLTRHHAAKLS